MFPLIAFLLTVPADTATACRLEPRALIPTVADESFVIGRTAAIVADVRGRLFIADQSGPEGATIHVVGPDGRRRGSLGRVGSGPGEYRNLDGGLVQLRDGSLVVRDAPNGRFVVFDAEGRARAHWPLRPTYGFTPLLVSGDGFASMVAFRPGENGFGRRGGQVVVRIGADGRVRDTLRIPEPQVPDFNATMQSASGLNLVPVPFAARPLWTFRPTTGFLVARSDEPWVESVGPGENHRVDLALGERPSFAPGERDAVEARFLRSVNDGARISGPSIPEEKPYIRALWAAPDDRTWVLHHVPGVARKETDDQGREVTRWTEPLRITILSPSAVPVLRLDGPPVRYDPRIAPAIRGDSLWLAVEDDTGTPRILKLEVACGPPRR